MHQRDLSKKYMGRFCTLTIVPVYLHNMAFERADAVNNRPSFTKLLIINSNSYDSTSTLENIFYQND